MWILVQQEVHTLLVGTGHACAFSTSTGPIIYPYLSSYLPAGPKTTLENDRHGCEPDGVPTGQGGACRGCCGGGDVSVHAVQDWSLCGAQHVQPEGERVPVSKYVMINKMNRN